MQINNKCELDVIAEMKDQNSRVLLFKEGDCTTVFFLENGRIAEVWNERSDAVKVGDIYLGRVTHCQKNINAYYVEVQKGISVFVPSDEICDKKEIQEGSQVLVQIKKEAYKAKLALATMHLEIPGEYSVVDTGDISLHFSKKLSSDRKDELRNMLEENIPLSNRIFHILIRTAAETCKNHQMIVDEITKNQETLEQIIQSSQHMYPLCKMFGSTSVLELLFTEQKIKEDTVVVTENHELYERMKGIFHQRNEKPDDKLIFYQDVNLPMSTLYGLKSKFHEITDEKIWLKSGGYLYICPTEAMVVIDVNTGKYTSKDNREDTFLRINLEAAREIAFQIRARNLSGIIIVDFINMKDEKNTTILMNELNEALQRIAPKGIVIDVTKLGLIEITREKKRPDIYEISKAWIKQY